MKNSRFPEKFLWGVSTASAQIEGGRNEGGRTDSIWDVAPKNKIKDGCDYHNGPDFYHHVDEDIESMRKIGVNSYRFSISWSRIYPQNGQLNEEGIKFYSDLVDKLLKNKIEPIITLYHWDLPLRVDKEGGWKSKKIIDYFKEYAKAVVEALSDRVTYWLTFNEPTCFLMNGYMVGAHAPFKKNIFSLNKVSNIFMLTNYEAVNTIRKYAKLPPKIGLSFGSGVYIPRDENDPKSIEEARYKSFNVGMGVMNNKLWFDPIILGKAAKAYGGMYHTKKKDLPRIKVDLDFLALNNYEALNYASMAGDKDVDKSKLKLSSMGWVIDGRSLYWDLKFMYERYKLPILITENGVALEDEIKNDKVNDTIRSEYIDEYLINVKKAINDGVPVLGYQYWSLMDNFEWAEGYKPRFGLIYIDYATKKRTLKESAYHYGEIIKSNGSILGE